MPAFPGLAYLELAFDSYSRTAADGVVAVDSSPVKAALGFETGDAHANLADAVQFLQDSVLNDFDTALTEVNRRLTAGFSATPGASRSFNSEIYSYADFRSIPILRSNLGRFLRECLVVGDDRAATSLRAAEAVCRIHWDVNVHGHFFADGCSRTALVFGHWFLAHRYGCVAMLPARETYMTIAAQSAHYAEFQDLLIRATRLVPLADQAPT